MPINVEIAPADGEDTREGIFMDSSGSKVRRKQLRKSDVEDETEEEEEEEEETAAEAGEEEEDMDDEDELCECESDGIEWVDWDCEDIPETEKQRTERIVNEWESLKQKRNRLDKSSDDTAMRVIQMDNRQTEV